MDSFVKETLVEPLELSPAEIIGALVAMPPERRAAILDSGGNREPDARFLIAGFDPFETVDAGFFSLTVNRRDGAKLTSSEPFLKYLDARVSELALPRASSGADLPACGACLVTLNYEFLHALEHLRGGGPKPGDDQIVACGAFYDSLIIHDYRAGKSFIASVAGIQAIERIRLALSDVRELARREMDKEPVRRVSSGLISNFSRDSYLAAVRQIKEHIACGNIYQANLTQQLTVKLDEGTSPADVFMNLRREHPASFSAFIQRRDDTVVSASPERFFRVEFCGNDGVVHAWPIKGTRPRGVDPVSDARLREQLFTSEKDRAENVMIVDLLRNDLGRVCRFGSVEVSELFTVQEHPTLFHLVSKVRGILRDHISAGDLLRATFPCGSITGAPKIRAMEIIGDIEPDQRGLSMGAIGYISFDGRMDFNVAIRTMTIRNGMATFNVGGGIVADSEPEAEYEESLVKARALLTALGARTV